MGLWWCTITHHQRVQSPVSFMIFNVCVCSGKMDAQKWRKLFDHKEWNIIFCGDFNARGTQRDSSINNKQDEDLEDTLVVTDLVCINNGRLTRLASRPEDADSIIGLALVLSAVASRCRWFTLGFHGSDHYPCVTLINNWTIRRMRKKRITFLCDKSSENTIRKIRHSKSMVPIGCQMRLTPFLGGMKLLRRYGQTKRKLSNCGRRKIKMKKNASWCTEHWSRWEGNTF